MAMLMTTESLFGLKQYFDSQFEHTMAAIQTTDSDRLVKNKINGFIISIQDKLFELKPKLQCNGCGGVGQGSSMSQVSHTPVSQTRPKHHQLQAQRTQNNGSLMSNGGAPGRNMEDFLKQQNTMGSQMSNKNNNNNPLQIMSQPAPTNNPILMQSFSTQGQQMMMTPSNGSNNNNNYTTQNNLQMGRPAPQLHNIREEQRVKPSMKVIKTQDFQDEAPINWDYKSPNRQAAVGQNQTQYAKGFNVTDSMSLRSLNGESPEAFLRAN